jgi:hypothetical protein
LVEEGVSQPIGLAAIISLMRKYILEQRQSFEQ